MRYSLNLKRQGIKLIKVYHRKPKKIRIVRKRSDLIVTEVNASLAWELDYRGLKYDRL